MTNVSVDWSKLLREITLYTIENKGISVLGTDIYWPLIIQFPMCQTIDLAQYFDIQTPPKQILFRFNVIEDNAVSLRIEDNILSPNRTLKSQVVTYSGPTIQHKNMASPMIKRFVLTLDQTINSMAEKDINCTNYPNENFSSFKECDEQFVLSKLNNTHDRIMPFWATGDIDKVTHQR